MQSFHNIYPFLRKFYAIFNLHTKTYIIIAKYIKIAPILLSRNHLNRCFSKEDMEALLAEIPADRIGQPAEVAQMVLSILQTPEYLTGQIITLDGGWI